LVKIVATDASACKQGGQIVGQSCLDSCGLEIHQCGEQVVSRANSNFAMRPVRYKYYNIFN
jgi:hypothetical protein